MLDNGSDWVVTIRNKYTGMKIRSIGPYPLFTAQQVAATEERRLGGSDMVQVEKASSCDNR